MEFCKSFNAATKDKGGIVVPVVISVYKDRSFSFVLKSPPAAVLLKKAAGLAVGAKTPGKETVGKVTKSQVRDIARQKKDDLTAANEDAAMRIIEGTARSMGIEVTEG